MAAIEKWSLGDPVPLTLAAHSRLPRILPEESFGIAVYNELWLVDEIARRLREVASNTVRVTSVCSVIVLQRRGAKRRTDLKLLFSFFPVYR